MAIPINVIDDVRYITTNSMVKDVDEIEDLNNKIKTTYDENIDFKNYVEGTPRGKRNYQEITNLTSKTSDLCGQINVLINDTMDYLNEQEEISE